MDIMRISGVDCPEIMKKADILMYIAEYYG